MPRDTELFAAFVDGRPAGHQPRVCGVRLRPFSLWHLLLLQALESPFTCRGEVTRWDLRTALGICRLRFGDSRIRRPWLGPWRLRRGLRPLCAEYLSYLGDHLRKPEYAIVERPGAGPTEQTTSAPEIIRIVGDLIAWSHWPEWKVWELPPGRAHWYYAMALRAHGSHLSFMDDEEREFQDQMRAAEAHRAAGS